ncbi:MAG: hypothetical protein NT007_01080 [Candidatus Kapabacteria bacterium]|nr:hypothetical protein [Candidatus Kapabacteria bacterium]
MKNEPTKPLQSKFKKVEIEKTDDANNSSAGFSKFSGFCIKYIKINTIKAILHIIKAF